MRRIVILAALVLVLALPFALRPPGVAVAAADDQLVIVTPHNEAIRHEFTVGFSRWYKEHTGRTVAVDWRVPGGTSDISRFIEGEYVASFRYYWEGLLHRRWSSEVQSGFQAARLPPDASPEAREARRAFLASSVSCGLDLFFGGGNYDFERQAAAGRLVDSGVQRAHPEWFADAAFPVSFGGETYRDPHGLWFGSVLSSYGILSNTDAVRRLGLPGPPGRWEDLADPRLVGQIALCDPTKSGTIAAAFENVIQQRIGGRLEALRRERASHGEGGVAAAGAGEPAGGRDAALEARAVREGWLEGLQLLQRIGANARYFTDTSQKPAIDVGNGDCAAGMCIDFYGREQQEALWRRGHSDRVTYISPPGGSAYSVDPIALMRGAPHAAVAKAFIAYTLSLEGQKLWNFRAGVPGGPSEFALRRLPVRRDFYARREWRGLRTDPDTDPYAPGTSLVYHPAWTGPLFRELGFICRVMCQDTHPELIRAWRAVCAAPEPARSRALAALQDLDCVTYDRALTQVKGALNSRDQADEVTLARDLASRFRQNYARATAIAQGR